MDPVVGRATGAGADVDPGQAEQAVPNRGGDVDGAHPVGWRRDDLAEDQSGAQLDLTAADAVASGEPSRHAPHDDDDEGADVPPRTASAPTPREEQPEERREKADGLLHWVDEEHARVKATERHTRWSVRGGREGPLGW